MGVLPLLHIFHVQHKADYLEEFLNRRERKMHLDTMVANDNRNIVNQTTIWPPGGDETKTETTGPIIGT